MPPIHNRPANGSALQASIVRCHECDQLQSKPKHIAQSTYCCRCGCPFPSPSGQPLSVSLAWVVASLLVFILANVFPVITLESSGIKVATTLFGTAWQLSQEGMDAIAILIVLTGQLLPGLELLLMLYLLLPLSLGQSARGFARAMRLVRLLHPWGMIEVFLLGVLVSIVKLAHLAEVHTGIGLWSFFALMVLLACSAGSFDANLLWERQQACIAD